MKNIVKTILLLLLFYIPAGSWATFTKSAGLGLEENTAWMMSDQLPYIFENPSYATAYKNNIYFEFINGVAAGGIFIPLPFAEATLGLFSGSTVGTEIYNGSTFESLFHSGGTPKVDFGSVNVNLLDIATINSPASNPLQYKNLEAILAFASGNILHGFSVSFGFANDSTSQRVTIPENQKAYEEFTLSKSQFHLGYGLQARKKIASFDGLDAGIKFIKHNLGNVYKRSDNQEREVTAELKTDNAFDLALSARAKIIASARNIYFLHAGYSLLNRSTLALETDNISATSKNAEDQYSRVGHKTFWGVSNEIVVAKFIGVLWGSQLEWKTFTNEYSGHDKISNQYSANPFKENAHAFTMPLILGVRSRFSEKLDVSFALRHNIVNSADNSEKTTQTRANLSQDVITNATVNISSAYLTAASNVSMAVSYSLGPFALEWLLNAQIFQDGPYFLSGSSNALATSFAVTFNFDKVK